MPARHSSRPLPPPVAGTRRRFVRAACALAVCVLLAAPGFAARADIQLPAKSSGRADRAQHRQQAQPEGPPSAVEQRARVRLEGRVDIVLESLGHVGETVDFLIRTQPTHGTLTGPPRQLTRNTAVVTYVHRAADGPQGDSFTFATQADAGPVSAAATVAIDVIDAAPDVIVTPAEVDFGTVNAGDTSRAEITLENRGGGAALGKLLPPAPWEVEGVSDYHLAHGQKQTFALVFHPWKSDAFLETMHFPGAEGWHGVRLIGTGLGETTTAAATPAPESAGPPPPPAQSPPLTAVPDSSGNALPMDRAPAAPSTPDPTPAPTPVLASAMPPVARGVATPGAVATPAPADPPTANDAQVQQLRLRAAGSDTLEIVWAPPAPLPKSYRVEVRYLLFPIPTGDAAQDAIAPPRVEWRLYSPVDFHATSGQVTARLRGLGDSTLYAVRVVTVDAAGQWSAPSPVLFARTRGPSTLWHPTLLKVLVVLLLVCVAAYLRRRWQERQELRALEEERVENAEFGMRNAE